MSLETIPYFNYYKELYEDFQYKNIDIPVKGDTLSNNSIFEYFPDCKCMIKTLENLGTYIEALNVLYWKYT